MSSLPEHAARARHHRTQRPTSHWSADLTDTTPHPGIPSACETCRACRTCNGSGEVSPNPHAASTPALILTDCPDCGGSGERGAS